MEELAGIIVLGILAQWLAWKVKVPAILPLILTGLVVGPLSTLWTEDGSKLINPVFNGESGLFPGNSLFYFVSLAIGIILFEGGLTLKVKEIKETQRSIIRLISIGSLVTFIGAGLADHYLMGQGWSISFLFAGLVIVTGPTVIAPILQNIPLNRNVATVLKWEGILIDPIGALVAVLVFEFVSSTDHGMAYTSHAFGSFISILINGFAFGFLGGWLLYHIIKREWVPHYLLNVFTLAYVLLVFTASHLRAEESGLLAVVIMGLVLANRDTPRLKEILFFKESLSVLLISILFILLAANMNIDDLMLLVEDWRPITLFIIVALVLRPISVFLSTMNGNLTFNEKLFISWVGPRGIVAAGIASLFGLKLAEQGVEGAEYITPLVFMIVLGTVLLNATTARLVARLLGVIQDTSSAVLIIGANNFAIAIGKYLKAQGRAVHLVDSNERNVKKAEAAELHGLVTNIYNDDLAEQYELTDVGFLLAFTGSNEVNEYAIKRYTDIFGEKGAYRLITADELKKRSKVETEHIFSYNDDFIDISDAHRESAEVHERELYNQKEYLDLLAMANAEKYVVPLFLKFPDDTLHVIPHDPNGITVNDGGYKLVYLGVELPEAKREGEEEVVEEGV